MSNQIINLLTRFKSIKIDQINSGTRDLVTNNTSLFKYFYRISKITAKNPARYLCSRLIQHVHLGQWDLWATGGPTTWIRPSAVVSVCSGSGGVGTRIRRYAGGSHYSCFHTQGATLSSGAHQVCGPGPHMWKVTAARVEETVGPQPRGER